MKKINKSLSANPLTEFAKDNFTANWDDFRNHNQSVDYKKTKSLVFNDQYELCAFCETKVIESHKQQLEHFHAKSDKTETHNWALDWLNIIGVCSGGRDANKTIHPLPANLSCDAYKDYLITQGRLSISCEGYLLNPLYLSAFPCLFDLDKRTGELKIKDNYDGIDIESNQYDSTAKLIESTIEILNLNCDRLKSNRLEVLKFYNQEVKKMRENGDKEGFKKLAERWFSQKWHSYFTTRRIFLSNHAETHLKRINYDG
jgi:uncharacterized protein (TIGR02646 family)